jgi:hypothetical protein
VGDLVDDTDTGGDEAPGDPRLDDVRHAVNIGGGGAGFNTAR